MSIAGWAQYVVFFVTVGCNDVLGFQEGKPYPADAGGSADSSAPEASTQGDSDSALADAPTMLDHSDLDAIEDQFGTGGADGSSCSPGADPAQTPCLVDETYGVFVSPTGNDQSGAGTRQSPFKTIKKGIEQGANKGKSVYVCATAAYDERLVLDMGASGTRLYGGFDCGTWSHLANTRTVLKPSAAGIVLTATKVRSLLIEDFEFDAHDGVAPGDTSTATLIASSDGVRLVRTKVVAGRGMDGPRGTSLPASQDLDGKSPVGTAGAACVSQARQQPGRMTCDNGETSNGGQGGSGVVTGANTYVPATDGDPGMPADLAAGRGGFGFDHAGGSSCMSYATGLGENGSMGGVGSDGTGASGSGAIDALGWHPPLATSGKDGHVGQGGGGAGGGYAKCGSGFQGASGGSGGSGGCGGKGGGPGGSGGASLALVVYQCTNVVLEGSEFVASNAGKGGDGGAGQLGGHGAPGGSGGLGVGDANILFEGPPACTGGTGGSGGPGGIGGGGAGGHSIAIAYNGVEPLLIGGTEAALKSGTAGLGGADGNGRTTGPTAGTAGQSASVLQL